MSRTIANNLENFYNSVSPNIEKMVTVSTDYESKLTTIKNLNDNVSQSLSLEFKSSASNAAIMEITTLNEKIDELKQIIITISDTLNKVKIVLNNIESLKKLKKDIDNIESNILSNNINNHENTIDNINGLNFSLTSKQSEFDKLENETIKLLNELTGIENSVSANTNTNVTINSSLSLGNLNFKTLPSGWSMAKASFKASSGNTVEYILYLPPNYNSNVKTPLVTSLHGSLTGDINIDRIANASGVSYDIKQNNGNYTANTIVLSPMCANKSWSTSETVRIDLKELTDTIISEYNIDMTKNIITGNSMGGSGAIYMAANYPGYYSDVVAYSAEYIDKPTTGISSKEELAKALMSTNVITYWETEDKNSYPQSLNEVATMVNNNNGHYESNSTAGQHCDTYSQMVRGSTGFNDLINKLISD